MVVEYPPDVMVSGYLVAVLAAFTDESGASKSVVTISAVGRINLLNIKKTPSRYLREKGGN
jgi:hypothetical protein